jgi:hypothetical protein
MASPNTTTKVARPYGTTPTPISQHFGPGVKTVQGTSVLQINNLNKGQSDRTITKGPGASTNTKQALRPANPNNSRVL